MLTSSPNNRNNENKNFERKNVLSQGLGSYREAVRWITYTLMRAGYRDVRSHKLEDDFHYAVTAKRNHKLGAGRPDIIEMFYVKWERELFRAAGAVVPGLKNSGTRGACTLNVELAERAADYPATTILFANREEKRIYEINAIDFMEKSVEYTQRSITQEVVRCIAVERLNPWELERFYPSFDEVYFHTAKEELQEQVQKIAFSPSEPVEDEDEEEEEEEEEEVAIIEASKKRVGRPKKGKEVEEEPPREKGEDVINQVIINNLLKELSVSSSNDNKSLSNSNFGMILAVKLAYQLGVQDERNRQERRRQKKIYNKNRE